MAYTQSGATGTGFRSQFGPPVAMALVIFAACLFGISTRPIGFLATVWPANAIMLGLLIRMPGTASALGWAGAALAYLAADLLTGSSLPKALILNGANLAGVAAAYMVYARLPDGMTRLEKQTSMLWLVIASAAAGAAAGLFGALANPLLFDGGAVAGWTFWFATELVNYMAFLPVILLAPAPTHNDPASGYSWSLGGWADLMPAAALVASCALALLIGGPGAIAFPVPALLWCGLVYSVFRTSVLVLIYVLWTLIPISADLVGSPAVYDEMSLVSARLGIALVAMGPIMLGIVTASRARLLGRLRHLAAHDQLTGASSRAAFAQDVQEQLSVSGSGCALMMIDLDRFKAVNDTFGHAAGDEVLVAFAERVRRCLRKDDLFGRQGGEEFVVFVADSREVDAIAERIRVAVNSAPVTLNDGRAVEITASIGLLVFGRPTAASVDALLVEADALLYRAKNNGRDRVERAAAQVASVPQG